MRVRRHTLMARIVLVSVICAVLATALTAVLRSASRTSVGNAAKGPYLAAAVRPSTPQAVLDADVRRFYGEWKSAFVRADCGHRTYQVYSPDAQYPYTSEAQGYGLVIAATMSDVDRSARMLFDGILRYVLAHPSVNSDELMAAEQDAGCSDAGGSDSATDGDMDIAYALLLADRTWGSAGGYDYRGLALRRIAALKSKVVNPRTKLMLLGDWSTRDDPRLFNVSRTSDWNVHHFRMFASATGDPEWDVIRRAHQRAIAALQTGYSPATGLLPDFARASATGVTPVSGKVLESEYDGDYYFNACRAPWRIGLDAITSGDGGSLEAARRINAWAIAVSAGDPDNLGAGYTLAGRRLVSASSSAFFAPMAVAAMTDPAGQHWLDALWMKMAATPVDANIYFGATIQLQVMLIVSGKYTAI